MRIKESVTGVSEEMAGVGIAMSRAEDKTEQMKAKAKALDEMIDSGVLTDYTNKHDDMIERELQQVSVTASVEEELEKLKVENARKKKKSALEQIS